MNGDVLLTYRVNPWTALYAGYNGNGQNLRLIETPEGNRIFRRPGLDLALDASQVFVKFSYLVRF